MQWHRDDSRTATQRRPPHHVRQESFNFSRDIRLSFQQQHRLTQRALIAPNRPRSRKRQLLTPAAPLLIRHPTFRTNPFLIREDPCSPPTRLTRNSESSLLDTLSTDYADLRIRKREDRIVNTCEVHTKTSGLPESRRPQIISNQNRTL